MIQMLHMLEMQKAKQHRNSECQGKRECSQDQCGLRQTRHRNGHLVACPPAWAFPENSRDDRIKLGIVRAMSNSTA